MLIWSKQNKAQQHEVYKWLDNVTVLFAMQWPFWTERLNSSYGNVVLHIYLHVAFGYLCF